MRQVMTLPKILYVEEPWRPVESETDPKRASKIVQMLGTCLKEMERTSFFQSFTAQVEGQDISALLRRVMGTEMKMQMVIYGIGSIESRESSRLQLTLALLMRRKFNFIGEIQAFDPMLTATECQVLEELGCSVLSVNEKCRRAATKPTLFYIPHCPAYLYNNLLHANWSADRLSNIVLLGNSFKSIKSLFKRSSSDVLFKLVLAIRDFTEFKIQTDPDDRTHAFFDLSWHFFDNVLGAKLSCICL